MVLIVSIAVFIFFGAVSTKNSKTIFRISMFVLFLFTMFRTRSMGGVDVNVYITFFKNIVPPLSEFDWRFWSYTNSFEFGWGYTLLNSIAKSIDGEYFTFQILNTCVVFALLNINIKKMNMQYNEKCMLLFIYYCYEFFWYFFGLLRQNIANLIIWYILIDIEQKKDEPGKLKYIKYLLLIYIASLFHASAILILILYPMYLLFNLSYPTKTKIWTVLILSVGVYFLGGGLFKPIVNVVIDLAGDRYEVYSEMNSGGANIINFFIKYVFIFIMTYMYNQEEDNSVYVNTTLLAILISSINSAVTIRMVEYFAIGYYAGTAQASFRSRLDHNSKKIYTFGIFAIFLLILVRFVFFNAPYLMNYTTDLFTNGWWS